MSATHRVKFFEAACKHCRRSFPIPLLGDFSYGEFILHGERGGVFGYLAALQCPSFDEIHSRLLAIAGRKEFPRGEITRFQEVMASCADELAAQHLGLTRVCPYCHSTSVEYGDAKPLDISEIPVVTFTKFQSLSNEAKREQLTELWKHSRQSR